MRYYDTKSCASSVASNATSIDSDTSNGTDEKNERGRIEKSTHKSYQRNQKATEYGYTQYCRRRCNR